LEKKREGVFGLGFVAKTLAASSSQQARFSANSRDVDDLKSLIHALDHYIDRSKKNKK